jgi:ribosomal protein L24E
MAVAALLTATVATPALAAIPDGALSKLSPVGASSEAVIDDTGTVVAYLQGPTGHVMVNDRPEPVVRDAGAREIEISGDGNTIVFSTDKALAGGDANSMRDIYAVNRDGANLRLVSTAAGGVGAFSPSVNGNGGVVAWSGDAGAVRKIFVRDGGNAPAEAALPGGVTCDCVAPSINHDGSAVAFEVTDSGVFVWRRGGTAQAIDKKGASRPSLSGSGRIVAYQFQNNINVFNLDTGESTLVPADGLNPALSADGTVVAFQASGALTNDTNKEDDVAVWDLPGRRLITVSTRPDGMTGNGGSFQPSINSDGGRVAFESVAGDLLPGDGNGLSDVFLRIPGTGAVAPVCCTPGPGGDPVIPDIPDIPGSYWLVASDGGIFSFAGPEGVRSANFFGSTGAMRLNQPIVGMASHPTGRGYWFVASDGGVFTFGASDFFGSTGSMRLNRPIVGMAATPSGNGYWLVADDGGIFTFGDAKFFGSTGSMKLNKPIVGMASTPSGNGYYMVATDGGIFTFGDAKFAGSTGAMKLNKPIVGMATRAQGDGYWLVASDGGIFAFGSAPFLGSTGAMKLNQPIVGMSPTSTGSGYWFVASDGGIFTFGDAGFFGSTGAMKLNKPIVGMAGFNN